MVLGGGADHGRAADVDVLDRSREIGAARDRRLEGVEVDDHEVDGRDAVLAHRLDVRRLVAAAKMPPWIFGCSVLTRPSMISGKPVACGDLRDGEAGLAERLGRAAGGENLDAPLGEEAGEADEAGLVGDRDQGAADGDRSSALIARLPPAPSPSARGAIFRHHALEQLAQLVLPPACRSVAGLVDGAGDAVPGRRCAGRRAECPGSAWGPRCSVSWKSSS